MKLLCGKARVQAPEGANAQGLKITEKNALPLLWHLQMVRCSSLLA